MDAISRTYPAGNLRISDADRDAVVAELSEHFEAGRLTIDELDERTGQAISARTGTDLDGLLADLPASPGGLSGSATAVGIGRGLPRQAGCQVPCALMALPLVPIVAVAVVLAVLGQHGVVGVPLWLIPVWYLVLRRMRRNSR